MIIVCNGAFKSGSTWLYLIVEELLKIKNIPFNLDINEQWVGKNNSSFLFKDKNIADAIPYYLQKGGNYLTKTHLLDRSSYRLLAQYKGVNLKVIFIDRNIGDAVVSHYHHVITQTEKRLTFNRYYNTIGRYKAKEIESFKRNKEKFLVDEFELSFESLKKDFNNQVQLIAKFLQTPVTNEEIEQIKKNTSLRNLKEKAKEGKVTQYSKDSEKASKLFRKGKIGESEDFLNSTQKKDIQKIVSGKTSLFFDLYYFVFFKLRRKIYKI